MLIELNMDLKSKTDEELIALLPSEYVLADEGTSRGLKRMRWMNAIRRTMEVELVPQEKPKEKAVPIIPVVTKQDHRKYLVEFADEKTQWRWVLFACFDDKPLAHWWKRELLRDGETKTRLRWRD